MLLYSKISKDGLGGLWKDIILLFGVLCEYDIASSHELPPFQIQETALALCVSGCPPQKTLDTQLTERHIFYVFFTSNYCSVFEFLLKAMYT